MVKPLSGQANFSENVIRSGFSSFEAISNIVIPSARSREHLAPVCATSSKQSTYLLLRGLVKQAPTNNTFHPSTMIGPDMKIAFMIRRASTGHATAGE